MFMVMVLYLPMRLFKVQPIFFFLLKASEIRKGQPLTNHGIEPGNKERPGK